MNGLRKQQTSKTSGFLNSSVWWLLALLLVGTFSAHELAKVARAQQRDTLTAERINEHVVLFRFEGREYMGFDETASKPLKQAENDAKAFKAELEICHDSLQKANNNTQDERVRAANIKSDYEDQSKLLTQCMASVKNGPKILGDWRIELGLKVAPTAVGLFKRCN